MNAALGGAFLVTPHHLQCVRRVHKIDADPVHCYHGNFSSPTYSQTFVDWLLERYREEPLFFENCKAAVKTESTAVHNANDPSLLWLAEHMSREGISTSALARKMKISAATISRLLRGHYKGDVPAMLARISSYRHQITVDARETGES